MASKDLATFQSRTGQTTNRSTSATSNMSKTKVDGYISKIQDFTHFYFNQTVMLYKDALQHELTLLELHVLHEIGKTDQTTVKQVNAKLQSVNPEFLDLVLRKLSELCLIEHLDAHSEQEQLFLTDAGRQKNHALNAGFRSGALQIMGKLSTAEQMCMVDAMNTVQQISSASPQTESPYVLRAHQPGDIGWVVHRHGVLYFQEYGWDEQFEALVAEIAAQFIKNFNPKYDKCWIAEKHNEIVGFVLLMKHSDTVAKLRLLIVEPSARGLGVGSRLVNECIAFATEAKYKKIELWTQSILHSAIRIYKAAGFILVKEDPHHSFGHDLIAQTWELLL